MSGSRKGYFCFDAQNEKYKVDTVINGVDDFSDRWFPGVLDQQVL